MSGIIMACTLSAMSFIINISTEFNSDIGLKSLGEVGLLFFGIKVMKEFLIACKRTLPAKKSLQTWYISSLMICHHFFINMPLKPSGPGALSTGIYFTTLSISSLVNGAVIWSSSSCLITSSSRLYIISGWIELPILVLKFSSRRVAFSKWSWKW